MTTPLVIWRLSDGKRGHDNQSLGLAEALARVVPVQGHELSVSNKRFSLICRALAGRQPAGLPRPQLLLGAGHATHLPLIALARACRAHSVVLMKPTLPVACFSACLIPEHDNAPAADNVLKTLGAVNRVRPGLTRNDQLGLILIGGPSKHHRWESQSLVRQISEILAANPDVHWHLAGSRRTPAQTLSQLQQLAGLDIHAFTDTTPDWLPRMLADCALVWVSADSVSMAYEAVSSGAATGILEVPTTTAGSRVERALEALLQGHLVTSMQAWRQGQALSVPVAALQEADRCAQWLLQRLHDNE